MRLKSRRSKACDFTEKVKKQIRERDGGCIFCQHGYMLPPEDEFMMETHNLQTMHFIPRSQGGLGVPENGAMGCWWHHNMMDNGNLGNREDMLQIFEAWLKKHYENWNKDDLKYNKWR